MAIKKDITIKLQGHEKFALREGWLTKGLFAVSENPYAFQGKEGPDTFGIGSNMVKSLRYWMRAFGLITDSSSRGAILTEMGQMILKNDPYLEKDFTLWLLHSNIARNADEATSWYLFFNRCEIEDLEREQIEMLLNREIKKYAPGVAYSDRSAKSDIDVLLNMYCKSKKVVDPEEKSISPLTQLELLKQSEGKYTKKHPDRKHISEWNILYELANLMKGLDSISIESAIEGENGLSRLYQITAVSANELLDRLDNQGYIKVDRTAGLDIIYRMKPYTPESVISEYYGRK